MTADVLRGICKIFFYFFFQMISENRIIITYSNMNYSESPDIFFFYYIVKKVCNKNRIQPEMCRIQPKACHVMKELVKMRKGRIVASGERGSLKA